MTRTATLLLAIGFLPVAATAALSEPTRYGAVTVSDENVLLFKGNPVQPTVTGNSSLDILKVLPLGEDDAVVIQDNGGSACPALFVVLTVTASAATPTKEFGTCSDLVKISVKGPAVLLTMSGFRGNSESQADQRKAARERHVFKVVQQDVTENGKPLNP